MNSIKTVNVAEVRSKEFIPVLKFSIAGERFAFELSSVDGIFDGGGIHTLPHAENSALCGLVNIRGELIIMIDAVKLFGLKSGMDTGRHRTIVWGGEGQKYAFEADSVDGIASVKTSDFLDADSCAVPKAGGFADKIFLDGGVEISLLDHELLKLAIEKKHL